MRTYKQINEAYKPELEKILQDLERQGCRCKLYISDLGDFMWGTVLTEDEYVLEICRDAIKSLGWNIILKYQPSRENGQGCRCNEEPISEISPELFFKFKDEGIYFARSLKAKMLDNPQGYFEKCHGKEIFYRS